MCYLVFIDFHCTFFREAYRNRLGLQNLLTFREAGESALSLSGQSLPGVNQSLLDFERRLDAQERALQMHQDAQSKRIDAQKEIIMTQGKQIEQQRELIKAQGGKIDVVEKKVDMQGEQIEVISGKIEAVSRDMNAGFDRIVQLLSMRQDAEPSKPQQWSPDRMSPPHPKGSSSSRPSTGGLSGQSGPSPGGFSGQSVSSSPMQCTINFHNSGSLVPGNNWST